MERDRRNTFIVAGLGILLLVIVVLSFGLGRYPVSAGEVLGIALSKIFPLEQFWADRTETVLLNIRFPRIILACLVGACLSATGAAYQGVFQNPMAAPDILGASAGAAFGAALAILNRCSSFTITLSAFIFSLLTVFLVYYFSKKIKGKSILGLILSGIVVGSLFSAATSLVKLVADPTDQLPAIIYWLMGSLAGAGSREIKFALIPMTLGLLPLLLLRWRMNVLTMGDDESRAMGINVNRIRLTVIICSTLTTAASVAVSGMIGWVGLVIPHVARKIVGNNYHHLLPASVLSGAIFMLLVDNVSRNLLTAEIPLGILTAFIGAPFFIYLMTRRGEYS
ncbi:MAG TPA: iron ABC transporter permease [Firmicutes bacterium]|jgi:iron complex transport system permease protein|nr:iron ABC transporter permease [Bacillota bacterium]